ncbi:hypothetical protein PsYK624_093210 [Phanerochaete sordida]|uniref:Septin-type G domain-containing protein n=1 Tax=Phanerochaete sordida TaxID=48140 RepID=A0A9P3LGJ8_9APHY|nr:hypothetical protein PsYK624_093210 [Phanerochaete sordida]
MKSELDQSEPNSGLSVPPFIHSALPHAQASMDPINVPGTHADDTHAGSVDTLRSLPLHAGRRPRARSRSASPRPSPPSPASSAHTPSSPSESVSSLPSVASSFLFSSGPGSPPHAHEQPHDASLIIPSLALPAPLRRPAPYGQALGGVRVLVLGAAGAGADAAVRAFAEEEDDVVEVHWEDAEVAGVRARVLRLSTDWIEHRDAHGLEKHEPSRNVEVVLLQDYGPDSDLSEVLRSTLNIVHAPFSALVPVLHPDQSPNALLANLLASPASPLYTAMVVVPSNHMTQYETKLISELSTHVPLVMLPSHQSSSRSRAYQPHQSPYSRRPSLQGFHTPGPSDTLRAVKLASIRPQTAHALRTCIMRSPEALSTLRLEAAERFMRWREVERAVGHVLGSTTPPSGSVSPDRTPAASRIVDPARRRAPAAQRWDKARWEEEWEGGLATDVAKTLRARRAKGMQRRSTLRAFPRPRVAPDYAEIPVDSTSTLIAPEDLVNTHFDPLHLPSVLAFSISLLGPLKSRIARMFSPAPAYTQAVGPNSANAGSGGALDGGLAWVLVGAFCAGVGVGVLLSRTV